MGWRARFPFGFFEKSRYVPLAGRYVVYPALYAVTLPPLPPSVSGPAPEVRQIRAKAQAEHRELQELKKTQ